MWDEERIKYLQDNWLRMSASQLAAALGGLTRNAVIGKAHRLGLPGRTKIGRVGVRGRPRPALVQRPRLPPRQAPSMPKVKACKAQPEAPEPKKRHQKPGRILSDAPPTVDFHYRERPNPGAGRPRKPEIELDDDDVVIASRIGHYPISPAIARAARGFIAYRARCQ